MTCLFETWPIILEGKEYKIDNNKENEIEKKNKLWFLCVSIPIPLTQTETVYDLCSKCTLSLGLSRPSLHNHLFGAQNC
jgi:hypothetical protein